METRQQQIVRVMETLLDAAKDGSDRNPWSYTEEESLLETLQSELTPGMIADRSVTIWYAGNQFGIGVRRGAKITRHGWFKQSAITPTSRIRLEQVLFRHGLKGTPILLPDGMSISFTIDRKLGA